MVSTFLIALLYGVIGGMFIGFAISLIVTLYNDAYLHIATIGKLAGKGRGAEGGGGGGGGDEVGTTVGSVGGSFGSTGGGTGGGDHFVDILRSPEAVQEPGLAIMRLDAKLSFLNSVVCRNYALRAITGEFHSNKVTPINILLIDFSCCGSVDRDGINVLNTLLKGTYMLQFIRYAATLSVAFLIQN